jgi:hypothetical protein
MPRPKSGTPKAKPTIVPRPRKPSGDPRPEADRAKSPTLIRRILDHGVKLGADKRLATQLGQLLMHGQITESECQAGFMYAEDMGRYERLHGMPPRQARSPSWEGGFKGDKGLDLEALERMDPAAADRIRAQMARREKKIAKDYAKIQACIPDSALKGLLDQLCCDDVRINPIYLEKVRKVLRALAAARYKLDLAADGRRKRAKSADATLMATAAVEVIANWFTEHDEQAKVRRFAIEFRHKRIALIAAGVAPGVPNLHHTVEIQLSGLMPEALRAQIVKAAEVRGWKETAPSDIRDSIAAIGEVERATARAMQDKPKITIKGDAA